VDGGEDKDHEEEFAKSGYLTVFAVIVIERPIPRQIVPALWI